MTCCLTEHLTAADGTSRVVVSEVCLDHRINEGDEL